jgi:hypothetical protein
VPVGSSQMPTGSAGTCDLAGPCEQSHTRGGTQPGCTLERGPRPPRQVQSAETVQRLLPGFARSTGSPETSRTPSRRTGCGYAQGARRSPDSRGSRPGRRLRPSAISGLLACVAEGVRGHGHADRLTDLAVDAGNLLAPVPGAPWSPEWAQHQPAPFCAASRDRRPPRRRRASPQPENRHYRYRFWASVSRFTRYEHPVTRISSRFPPALRTGGTLNVLACRSPAAG